MIISHEYKFIFIKTRKTAGSSIEKYLLNYLKDTDYVFTGMEPENMLPHNVNSNKEHAGWRWISKNYPNEWKSYFTFAVERNPWDRAVSLYHWYSAYKPKKVKRGFTSFIKHKNFENCNDWGKYANSEGLLIDSLISYETLHESFIKENKIPYQGELLKTFVKSGIRPKKDYTSYYNSETKEIISELYRNQISLLGYSF